MARDRPSRVGPLVARLTDQVARSPSGAASLAWAEVVGDKIAAHAWVDAVVGDTVEISVDSPAWSHHLQLISGELLARLRDRSGLPEPVRRLRFRPASRSQEPPGDEPDRPGTCAAERASARETAIAPAGPFVRRQGLTPEEAADLETVLARLADPALARALRGALGARVSAETRNRGPAQSGP